MTVWNKVFLKIGDITEEKSDAIVNAANNSLLGGGGVDGAIHRKAGAGLLEECRTLNGCKTGQAKITKGYDLDAPYVIHTVGPVYKDSGTEGELLESCYVSVFELMAKKGLKSVSFPSISTGAYGYPIEKASYIALKTTEKMLKQYLQIEDVTFVLFSEYDLSVYKANLNNLS